MGERRDLETLPPTIDGEGEEREEEKGGGAPPPAELKLSGE